MQQWQKEKMMKKNSREVMRVKKLKQLENREAGLVKREITLKRLRKILKVCFSLWSKTRQMHEQDNNEYPFRVLKHYSPPMLFSVAWILQVLEIKRASIKHISCFKLNIRNKLYHNNFIVNRYGGKCINFTEFTIYHTL